MDDATAQPWRHRHAVCTAATSDMVVPCHYGISVGRSVGIWQLEASSPGCGSRAGGGESRRGGAGHDGAGRAKTGRDKTGRPTGFLGDQGHHRRRRRPICRKVASLAASEVASAGPA